MMSLVPKGRLESAATIRPPFSLTNLPLAVMPAAFSPQHLGHGQYAVTTIFMMRRCEMGLACVISTPGASCISSGWAVLVPITFACAGEGLCGTELMRVKELSAG